MKQMNLEELKKCQLDILDYVASFCDSNNICYWLDSGTLIGAVRHHGYIPWDDDIDLGMLRKDYDKLISLFPSGNDCRYRLVCGETDKNCYMSCVKIIDTHTVLYEPDRNGLKTGVNIDIFAYDNAPDDDRLLSKQFKCRNFYRGLNQIKISKFFPEPISFKRIVKVLAYYPVSLFPSNYFIRKMIENAKRYSVVETRRVGNFLGFVPAVCSKEVFDSFIEVEFEGKSYKAPSGYDEWLRSFYGDYMQLPPAEKQKSHHSFLAYYLD